MAEHYYSAEPTSAARPTTVTFDVHGRHYELVAAGGVFAAGRLDAGTAVLLRRSPLPAAGGVLLDLGCGYGPIAVVLASQVPGATVWAVDVNSRALELTRANADRLGVAGRVRVAAPEQVPADVRFTQIWSNPPVRVGKPALHEMLRTWLPRLVPGGVARLVVGRHLGADSLQRWLAAEGWACERAGSAKGYRLLAVSAPSPERS